MPRDTRIAVIGGGLGGMAAAIHLAADGFPVTLYEKNDRLGGRLRVSKVKGYTFDLGPSSLVLPQILKRLFAKAGKNFDRHVRLLPVRPHCRHVFEDGTTINLTPEDDRMHSELAQLQADLDRQFAAFLDYSRKQYHAVAKGYFRQGIDSPFQLLRHYRTQLMDIDLMHTMQWRIEHHFENAYMRDIFASFASYIGSSPYRAPAFLNLLPHLRFEHDLWYVHGGMWRLTQVFEDLLRELGVTIKLNAEVTRIQTCGTKATAFTVNGNETLTSDVMVVNMDVIPAHETLMRESDKILHKLRKFEPSCSGLVIHLGLNRTYPKLAHHNVFHSTHQHRHFESVFEKHELPADPTVYVAAPTRTDANLGPPECDVLQILTSIPYINDANPYSTTDYSKVKETVLKKLEHMGLTGLRRHIVADETWTPFDLRNAFYCNRGSIYGVVSDLRRNYAFKAPKHSKTYSNLYFTGGSVNPGPGLPMVTLSGINVAQDIARRYA